MKMDKKEFIEKLSKQTNYDERKCNLINSIIEDTFIIGKKSKEKMIVEFKEKLKIEEQEANKVYEIVMQIIGAGIKDKLKHPFKSQD